MDFGIIETINVTDLNVFDIDDKYFELIELPFPIVIKDISLYFESK